MKIQSIDRKMKHESKSDDVKALNEEINHLILEKGELAQHLEKTQSLLKTRIDIEAERENMHKAEVKQLELQVHATEVRVEELAQMLNLKGDHYVKLEKDEIYLNNGIQYQGDTISQFSASELTKQEDLEAGANYLDLFLGKIDFDPDNIKQKLYAQIADLKQVVTFAVVDFYDHDTVYSLPAEGMKSSYNFEANYKIIMDEHLIYHFKTSNVNIEVYAAASGNEPIKIGEGAISLNELLNKNTQMQSGISYVVGATCLINDMTDKGPLQIGTLEYKLRLRFPLHEKVKWMQDYLQLNIDNENKDAYDVVVQRKRKLVIMVSKAEGLPVKSETFIYFQFMGKDYQTQRCGGSSPSWAHKQVIDVNYDEQFKSFLLNSSLSFVVFDDRLPVANAASGPTDVIGECTVKLELLVANSIIEEKLLILSYRNNQEKMGYLYVKIMWGDDKPELKPRDAESRQMIAWDQEIISNIAQALKSRGLTIYNSFKLFDRDNSNSISQEDFEAIVRGTLGLQIYEEELAMFYKRLNQPFNFAQFEIMFREYLPGVKDLHMPTVGELYGPQMQADPANMGASLQRSAITKPMLDMQKFHEIKQRVLQICRRNLKSGQTLAELFASIDHQKDGHIGIIDLKSFLVRYGIQASDEDVLLFLRHCDTDNNDRLSIEEFTQLIQDNQDSLTYSTLENSKLRQSMQRSQTSDMALLQMVLDKILDHMVAQKLSFPRLRDEMDINKTNIINQDNMSEFCAQKLKLALTLEESQVVFRVLDQSRDGRLSVDELIRALNARINQKNQSSPQELQTLYAQSRQAVRTKSVDHYLLELAKYMKSNNMKYTDIFSFLDKDKSGNISKEEMKKVFQNQIQASTTEDTFNEFYNYFDTNQSNSVSITEFAGALKPKMEELKHMEKQK